MKSAADRSQLCTSKHKIGWSWVDGNLALFLVTVSRAWLVMPTTLSAFSCHMQNSFFSHFPQLDKISTMKIVLALHTLTGQVISNKLGKLLIIKSNMGHITEWDAEQLRLGSSSTHTKQAWLWTHHIKTEKPWDLKLYAPIPKWNLCKDKLKAVSI